MVARIRVSEGRIARIRKLGDKYQRADWDAQGVLAAFSCNQAHVWPCMVNGQSTHLEKACDVDGMSPTLDSIADVMRRHNWLGGRFFVYPDRVETYGRVIARFEFTLKDRVGPAPSMPIGESPPQCQCPRCASFQFDGTRCGTCRFGPR